MSTDFFVGPLDEPDKYRLVHQVGAGGEAQLWKGELNVSGQWEPVAVKILRPDRLADLDQWKARWAEQAEVLRFIRHPGVVGVREHFEGGAMHYRGEAPTGSNALYLVMNWVDGVALRDWAPSHSGSDTHFEALRYLAQVGDVLDWLHSGQATPSGRPVVHADITPSNVLVTAAGQAVLVDFGLTRLVGGTSAVVEGTRGYMAPEVLAAAQYSPASDRYSFGALTYFVLTGQNPPLDQSGVRSGLAAVPDVVAQPGLIDHVLTMFAAEPASRPMAGEWIRFFRVSGTTSFGSGGGLRPTVPSAMADTTVMAPVTGRSWRRPWFVGTTALIVALIAGGLAFALSRTPASANHGASHSISTTTALAPQSSSTSTSESTTIPEATSTTSGPLGQSSSAAAFFLSNESTCCGSGSPATGGATINGQTFPHSIWFSAFGTCDQAGRSVTYNYDLGRQYSTFTATIGDLDDSALNVPVQWDVYLDTTNHPVSEKLVQGQSMPISVNVKGALTLILTSTFLSGSSSQDCNGDIYPAWGDAQVAP